MTKSVIVKTLINYASIIKRGSKYYIVDVANAADFDHHEYDQLGIGHYNSLDSAVEAMLEQYNQEAYELVSDEIYNRARENGAHHDFALEMAEQDTASTVAWRIHQLGYTPTVLNAPVKREPTVELTIDSNDEFTVEPTVATTVLNAPVKREPTVATRVVNREVIWGPVNVRVERDPRSPYYSGWDYATVDLAFELITANGIHVKMLYDNDVPEICLADQYAIWDTPLAMYPLELDHFNNNDYCS